MITLTTRVGSKVHISADKIVAVRACLEAEGLGTMITTSDGKSHIVNENVADILAELGESDAAH